VLAGTPLVTLPPTASFGELLDAFVANRAHRVHVVDDDFKPISIITLTDVLRLVTKTEKPEQVPIVRKAEDVEDDEE
jgi:CBS domain-containing protein